jgi:hypothetical protein
MLNAVVRDALLASLSGLVLAVLVWRSFPAHRKRIQRIVDFLSYVITLFALGTALFSVHRYEARRTELNKRLELEYAIHANFSDILMGLWKLCPVNVEPPKSIDCDRMERYLSSWPPVQRGSLYFLPRPPSNDAFADWQVREFGKRVDEQVHATNKAIADYNQAQTESNLYDPESIFLRMLVPSLALAFGLGAARRFLDIVTDWRA